MEPGEWSAWDERFHEIFSADNVEELEAIERDVDGQRPWQWLDDELHNPYLDAFEAVYGTRTGFVEGVSADGEVSANAGIGAHAETDADGGGDVDDGGDADVPPTDERVPADDGVAADGFVTLGAGGLVDPRGEMDLAERATKFWMELRGRWVERYSWAIPNREAVETIAGHEPIVEVGAGTGYWAYLLEQVGGDVVCYDVAPPGDDERWHEVRRGGPEVLLEGTFDDRTLFVCWPAFYETLAHDALEAYGGDTVVYVGEGPGGCNATGAFFGRLDEGSWRLEREVAIPQWPGVEDEVRIYER